MPHSNNQETARQLFLRLVTLGEGTEDTRGCALQSELYSLSGEQLRTVIRAFGDSRLLTFDHAPLPIRPEACLKYPLVSAYDDM